MEYLIKDYGNEEAEAILEAFEEKRPLVARATKNREELIKKLDAEGVRVSTDTIFPESLILISSMS